MPSARLHSDDFDDLDVSVAMSAFAAPLTCKAIVAVFVSPIGFLPPQTRHRGDGVRFSDSAPLSRLWPLLGLATLLVILIAASIALWVGNHSGRR